MDTEVIRSFLVSIGVKADEKGLKRFEKHVGDITKVTKEFAETMAAAAAAAAIAVVKVSEQFEDLYYASQRLRSSVENIKAFSFGVEQMGGNAQAARQSLESFASFLRSNPAGRGVVKGFFGVDASDGDAAAALDKIGSSARAMQARGVPYWAIKQRAEMVGIDENTLQAILRGTDAWSNKFKSLVDQNRVDLDRLALTSKNLMNSFRLLRAEIEIHFAAILAKIDPKVLQLGVTVAAVAAVLEVVALVAGGAGAAILALGVAVGLLVDDFNAWRNGGGALDWGPFADSVDQATAAIKNLLEAMGEFAGVFTRATDGLSAFSTSIALLVSVASVPLNWLADMIRVIADLLTGQWAKAWADAGKGGKDMIDGIVDVARKGIGVLNSFWAAMKGEKSPVPQSTGPSAQAHDAAEAAAQATTAANGNTPAQKGSMGSAMAYFMSQGWTAEQAAGIVANLQRESQFDPNAKGDHGQAYGLAQWHAPRQADFARWAGRSIVGSSEAQQLAFINYELTQGKYRNVGHALKRSGGAATAGALVSSAYEGPKDRMGEMALRGQAAQGILAGQRLAGNGGGTVTIQQKTDITLHGATDPQATAKAVGGAVDQANSNLVRNTRAAVK